MITELQSKWFDLASKYTEDETLITSLWEEVLKHYLSKNRYYHNLSHVQNMLSQAEDFKGNITILMLYVLLFGIMILFIDPLKRIMKKKAQFLLKNV